MAYSPVLYSSLGDENRLWIKSTGHGTWRQENRKNAAARDNRSPKLGTSREFCGFSPYRPIHNMFHFSEWNQNRPFPMILRPCCSESPVHGPGRHAWRDQAGETRQYLGWDDFSQLWVFQREEHRELEISETNGPICDQENTMICQFLQRLIGAMACAVVTKQNCGLSLAFGKLPIAFNGRDENAPDIAQENFRCHV
jgi:hypothetical protein